jgi:hypothetical protein
MTRALDVLRLLLGVVMVVTALQYFLPSLVTFWPAYQWQDPMAVRLMGEFDRSGLRAVAEFIHLVAGALLLVNRGVPFALAALAPVNVCGTFISLLVEGEPLIGLYAIVIMAANALLMFAYLPSYRGVLSPGQLADGEGPENGQNYMSLFTNPMSKASGPTYPGAAAVLVAAMAFYWFVVPGLNSTTGLVVLAVPAVLLAAGWARALGRKKA